MTTIAPPTHLDSLSRRSLHAMDQETIGWYPAAAALAGEVLAG